METEQVSAQAAVVLTLVGSSVSCTVLRGSLPELNEQADDLANLLVTVANAGEPIFNEDPRIAALAAEVEHYRREMEQMAIDLEIVRPGSMYSFCIKRLNVILNFSKQLP